MQMAPWLQLLLVRNFEFSQKKLTLFSNRSSFFDFDGNFCKKKIQIFFPKKCPLAVRRLYKRIQVDISTRLGVASSTHFFAIQMSE